ncbi:Gfo/Idh/MocA family oxidoreductase [bacterium]|nr:Gfo/Idh/MocA family oxidoreductase [bacterium]MDA7679696.1 Gfo/Idh/MocA family oxidoreductase [bacterium]
MSAIPRIALLGCGNWGKNLARNFNHLDALALVCDLSEAGRATAAEIAPGVATSADFSDAIQSNDIDAVAIATPAQTHFHLAEQALIAGKDVYLEKPMTLSVEEAEKLIDIADQRQRILMVGHLLLYSSPIQWIRSYIASGSLGKVQHISVKRAKTGKVRSHENVMWSFACHDIAAVLYLLNDRKPSEIKAVGNCFLQDGVEDDTHLHLKFSEGASAYIHSSWYWPDNERHYVVLGDLQWLKFDEVVNEITVYNKGIKGDLTNRDLGSFKPNFETYQPLMKECEHFFECLVKRSTPRSCGRNGLDVVRILENATEVMNGSSAD